MYAVHSTQDQMHRSGNQAVGQIEVSCINRTLSVPFTNTRLGARLFFSSRSQPQIATPSLRLDSLRKKQQADLRFLLLRLRVQSSLYALQLRTSPTLCCVSIMSCPCHTAEAMSPSNVSSLFVSFRPPTYEELYLMKAVRRRLWKVTANRDVAPARVSPL